jgi:hypothetical protein
VAAPQSHATIHGAAAAAMTPASPDFPGNVSPQHFGAEAGPLTVRTVEQSPEYDEMVARLDALEATVDGLKAAIANQSSRPGIGHNNPPPLDNNELDEIKQQIAMLKAEPPPAPAEAHKASSTFRRLGGKVLALLWESQAAQNLPK